MRRRLIAVAAFAVGVCLSVPAQASEASLYRLTPGGNLEPGDTGKKPPLAVFHPDRQPWQTAQATQDRRTEPPTAPGQTPAPTTAPGVKPPAGPVSASGFSLGNWSSVRKFFEERVQLVRFNVEGLFNYSEFQTGSTQGPLEGGRFSGVVAPAIRLTEDTALVFVYNASYNRDLQVFREDEGPRQRSEEQRHEFIALLSQDYVRPFGIGWINRLTLSPSVFQTYVFTRQTAAEDWGNGIPLSGIEKFKGLYDYWDRGAGYEVKLLHEREGERKHSLAAAIQAYQRHYRNFISLARQQDPASPEPKFEKDYEGILYRLTYEFLAPQNTSVRLAYSRLDRYFTDDRARVDPLVVTGVPGERRIDTTDTVDGRVAREVPFVRGLVLALGGGVSYNQSNSGFNDTLAPLPAAGVFSDQYYDYWSFRVEPELIYSREVNSRFLGLPIKGVMTFSLNYSYDRRAYKDRKAKDKDGGFRDAGVGDKDEIEVDVTHTIAPRLVYQFHKSWALLLEARRTIARSNFEDERVFRYNYDINSIGVGIQYRY